MATEINEGVVGLGISKSELKIRDTREAPGGPAFVRELGRDPKLENLRLAIEFVVILAAVSGRKTRDVHLPTIVVLSNSLGEEVSRPRNFENLIGCLNFGSVLVPKTTPWIHENRILA